MLKSFPLAKFRQTKGAIKLHVGLNHRGYLPEFVKRLKSNAMTRVTKRRGVLLETDVTSDQTIVFRDSANTVQSKGVTLKVNGAVVTVDS